MRPVVYAFIRLPGGGGVLRRLCVICLPAAVALRFAAFLCSYQPRHCGRKLMTVWFRRAHISLQLRLRLYASFVIPVLTYNMGTWGLTQADLVRIDTYHRRHLRQFIGVHWPNRISNVAFYHRCQCRPISESIVTARWRLFGHVLRLPRDAPAQRAIDHYFADIEAAAFRGRPRTSLPTTLCSDLRRIGRTLRQPTDIEALRALSREQWRQMERDISA